MKILSLFALLCAACSGGASSIPIPNSGSFTLTDAGVTVCTTVPLGAMVEAGAR